MRSDGTFEVNAWGPEWLVGMESVPSVGGEQCEPVGVTACP